MKENRFKFNACEGDLNGDGQVEKYFEVENYLWWYGNETIAEENGNFPDVFVQGYYLPVTQIAIYDTSGKCTVEVTFDTDRYILDADLRDEKLQEFLVNNTWYEYQPQLGEYYEYSFTEDGYVKRNGELFEEYECKGDKIYLYNPGERGTGEYLECRFVGGIIEIDMEIIDITTETFSTWTARMIPRFYE